MAQVSRLVLSSEEWQMMWQRFLDVFVKVKGKDSLHEIFSGLLSPTEKVVLVKRIVAGFLILSDWGAYNIAKTLKLSVASVYKYKTYIDQNRKYRKILKDLLPQKIPLEALVIGASGTSGLVKLLENIYEGYWHRSKLIYG